MLMKVLRDVPLDLVLDPILSFFVDSVCIIMVIINRKVFTVLDELVQLAKGCLTAVFQDIMH